MPRRALALAGRNRRTADFTNRQIATLFIGLAVITSIPIVLYPWPPLADYINHLARMHVIATVDGDPDLARFYEVNWQIIPNLMMDLVVPVLEQVMSVYLAGQVYTIASFVLILSGIKIVGTPQANVVIAVALGIFVVVFLVWSVRQLLVRRVATSDAT